MADCSVPLKRRKRSAAAMSSSSSSSSSSAAAVSSSSAHHPLSAFQWIQRLRDTTAVSSTTLPSATPTLVQCIVVFPDHTAAVVDQVPIHHISASLWGVDPTKDKDMLHPLDLDNRILAEPIRDDNLNQPRQGVFMSYNCHRSNPYDYNLAASRILADGGLLELGCVPSIRYADEPQTETVDVFFQRVLKHCTALCPRGPVIFFLADVSAPTGPVPIPFSSSYFNQVYPMLFRQDNRYNRMLREHPLFATLNRSIETLLTLNGSTVQGHYRYISHSAAIQCRNALFRDVWGHSEERIRSLVKTQLEEAELQTTICVLIHEFTMGKWQNVSRVPALR